MNNTLQQYARNQLKEGLSKLSESHITLFKRMYGKLDQDINDVVDNMPEDKLDWAMQQVERTLMTIHGK